MFVVVVMDVVVDGIVVVDVVVDVVVENVVVAATEIALLPVRVPISPSSAFRQLA